jgi:hypothetical protein
MESTGIKIILGIWFFELLFYALVCLMFGTFAALICLSIDIALYGCMMLYIDNFHKEGKK